MCFSGLDLKLALMFSRRLFHSIVLGKKERRIWRLSLLWLVTLPTEMRSSSGMTMAPSLALKRVICFDLALPTFRGVRGA